MGCKSRIISAGGFPPAIMRPSGRPLKTFLRPRRSRKRAAAPTAAGRAGCGGGRL